MIEIYETKVGDKNFSCEHWTLAASKFLPEPNDVLVPQFWTLSNQSNLSHAREPLRSRRVFLVFHFWETLSGNGG